MDALQSALAELGLGAHLHAFRAADVDLDVLPLLTDADLVELGLSLGQRRRLLAAIAQGRFAAGVTAKYGAGETGASQSEDELHRVTVLMCDIVGYAALSERLELEVMTRVVRQFRELATRNIARWEGFVVGFMGDAVLAFFGYPIAQEDAAERAVRAGRAIIEALREIQMPGGTHLAVRAAVASGSAHFSGNVRSDGSRESLVTGGVIHLVSRMQAAAPANGLVVSAPIRAQLRSMFDLEDQGIHESRGIEQPVQLWVVGDERRGGIRFEAIRNIDRSPILGREAEISLLRERWDTASTGSGGQVVVLSGEGGIGKSHIAQTLCDRIVGEPHMVMRLQCAPFHRNSALYPVIEQIRFAAGIKPADSPRVSLGKLETLVAAADVSLAEHVPPLADLLGIPFGGAYAPLDLAPDVRKYRLLQSLLEHTMALADRQPLLVMIEDAQWIDPTTDEFLTNVVMNLPSARIFLLVTARPEFVPGWAGLAHVTVLSLSGLPRRQALQLIERIAGGKPLPAELVELLLEKTEGIPLFVEEMTRAVLELGVVRACGDRYELAGPLTSLAIPATLHDSLLARLERSASAKQVAQIGAVIGREFSHAQLAAMAVLTGDALAAAIQELLRTDLAYQRGAADQTSYVFKHALIQDAAYSTLIPSRRQKLHAQCAAMLLELTPGIADRQPGLLAHHYTEAANAEAAIEHWLKAGREAARRSANREAVAFLRRGLGVLPQIADPDAQEAQELALQSELGVPLAATRGYAAPETTAAWERVRSLAAARGDSARLLRALYGLWASHGSRGEVHTALDLSTQLVETGRQAGNDAAAVVGHRVRGITLQVLGELAKARTDLETAVEEYDPDRHGDLGLVFGHHPRMSATAVLSTVLWLQGWSARAKQVSLATVEEAVRFRHAHTLAYVLAYGGCMVAMLRGDTADTLNLAEKLLALATERQLHLWRAYAHAYTGWALARQGKAEAQALLDHASSGFEQAGSGVFYPLFSAIIAYGMHSAGRTEDALRRVREAVVEAERRPETWCLPELLRIEARMLARRDETVMARDILERAMAVAQERKLVGWQLRIGCDLVDLMPSSNLAASRALLQELVAALPEPDDTPDRLRAQLLIEWTLS